MSAEFIKLIHKRVSYFCRRKKLIPFDDLLQSVYLMYLEGGHNHSTIEQVCIDVYREQLGRSNTDSREQRKNFNRPENIDELYNLRSSISEDSMNKSVLLKEAFKLVDKIELYRNPAKACEEGDVRLDRKIMSRIFLLLLHGYNKAEVARNVKLHPITVSKLIDKYIGDV